MEDEDSRAGNAWRVRRGDEGARDGRRQEPWSSSGRCRVTVWSETSAPKAAENCTAYQPGARAEARRRKISDLWRTSALLQISPNAARQDEIGEERENVEMKVMSYSTNKAEPSKFWTKQRHRERRTLRAAAQGTMMFW